VTNPKNLPATFFIPHERAIVKCDFSHSYAAADKISTDLRARAVSLRQLSYLFHFAMAHKKVMDVIKLISLVRANEILWDVTGDEYKLSEQKPLVWKSIAKELESDTSTKSE